MKKPVLSHEKRLSSAATLIFPNLSSFMNTMKIFMRHLLWLFLCQSPLLLWGQTVTWNGSTSSDWNTASNWSTNAVPAATNDVVIPSSALNQPSINAGTEAVAKSMEVQSDAVLTLVFGGSISINGSKSIGGASTALYNAGTVENSGVIRIGATASTAYYGLRNNNLFHNNAGGEIYIDRSSFQGLFNSSGTFTNAAKIIIGSSNAAAGNTGFYNDAIFQNNTGGEIHIDRTNIMGFSNNSGTFTNEAVITIGANASVGSRGFNNEAAFQNKDGGEIRIDRCDTYGLVNNDGTFTNEALIVIGANASVGTYGILNYVSFQNKTGGAIHIDQCDTYGIANLGGTFTNEGLFEIGANASVGTFSIANNGTFQNNSCGSLRLIRGNFNNSSSSSVTNAGFIRVAATLSNSGTFTNNGVLTYGTRSGSGTLTNATAPSLIVNRHPVTPIFTYGSTYDGTVNGIFTDENATVSAGTFSAPNDFIPSFLLPSGTQTLYAKITPNGGGCTFIVPFTFLVCKKNLTVGATFSPTACGGNQGSIAFTSDNVSDGTYSLSFTTTGTTTSPKSISVSGNSFTLSNLTAGTYRDFLFFTSGCLYYVTTATVLTDPPTPVITAGVISNPTTCSGNDGTIAFTGADLPNGTYPLSFTATGADATTSPKNITVSGNTFTLNGLKTGIYSNFSVTNTGCTGVDVGVKTLTDPIKPTATIAGTTTVCQNSTSPSVTFTGQSGTTPYTFTYKINGGISQTVSTTGGNSSVTVSVPTDISGVFTYSLESVSNPNNCSQTQTGSAVVTVNPVPTATITSTTTVCQNSPSPNVTFTGANATAPYTFTYKINGGSPQTVTTSSGNSVTVAAPTGTLGEFIYTLVSVSESSSTACSQTQMGSATVTVNSLPTATIAGTTTVCQNSPSPNVTFTGANATAPYTFTYKINGGSPQTVTTISGSSVTVAAPTGVAGGFTYTLVNVSESSSTACSQTQTGNATVTIQGKPTISLTTQQTTLNEGNNQTFCDTDANSVNSLQFTVLNSCVAGNLIWRVQTGSSAWSEWSSTIPGSQLSNNQPYRYQAACDANCPVTYTHPIEVKINYRASTPQNVSLTADGITVNAGESKEICNLDGNTVTFNATCAAGELLLYSVDGSDYSSNVPAQIVDNAFHNYRVRCRKADNTPSCVETESAVIRLKITTSGPAPTVSLSSLSNCGTATAFSGTSSCGALTTVWYNAATNQALPSLPSTTPNATTSYYARCQNTAGCLSDKSTSVTFTITPVNDPPVVTASSDMVCTGTPITISANCPAGSTAFWNTGVSTNSFQVAFANITRQTYWAKCIFSNGCQSAESVHKTVFWKAFELTFINIGQSKSATKTNNRSAWASQFITPDGGPVLENSTEANPTIYYSENVNKTAPRFWTIQVETCALGSGGSVTYDLLSTPETGVPRSYNTHENNAPYFMYANREGYTELYAQNHPAYGFYQDNGSGGNTYDAGLPKGLYKLGIRYWDQKGQGSIYPSTRQPAGNVLAYQEYWFRIQSKDGVGIGTARIASDNGQRLTGNGAFAQIMPNPVSHVLHLQVKGSKGREIKAVLMDAAGRLLVQYTFTAHTQFHVEEFDLQGIPSGLYFLQLNKDTERETHKVVKVE